MSVPIKNLSDAELAAFARAGNSQVDEVHLAILRCLADVEEERVEWLWPDVLPRGCLVMLVGDPGASKSLFGCDLAARITRGDPWPDGQLGATLPTDVMILAAEDSPAAYRRRMAAAGADLDHVHILAGVRRGDGSDGESRD